MIVRGIICEPGKPPMEAEVDTQFLGTIMGDNRLLLRPFKDRNVGVLVNENYANGNTGMEHNRNIGGLFKSVSIYGNMFVAGLEVDGSLLSLSDQQIKLYMKQLAK
ncbi:MAG: hypothetical protein J6X14_08270 [Lachnospiraceae bacterium]|jgi:hypothetical protein|nr:hypothetical protein [Lachnospiraceae bacterium]MCR5501212.1 hypothetical protein [Acetatifactor sp.]MBO7339230.1 hypothetical protein [Lachnospiraceae bacterium]MBP5264129.1 hypothetical protein [Lachnospiraceae bacterium]MBP5670285.1 hypothetical protein [Lachnospiraceae bacterium]